MSLRHQDAQVKVDRTGAARWILGPHGGWNEPWRDRLLQPQGDLEWPYHGHGVEVTPAGTILLFDNGNNRALPFDEPMPSEDSYSRAVEYAVDEEALTVRQAWAYPGPDAEPFYSSFLSDADWLPRTGNVLITDGGRTRPVETQRETEDGETEDGETEDGETGGSALGADRGSHAGRPGRGRVRARDRRRRGRERIAGRMACLPGRTVVPCPGGRRSVGGRGSIGERSRATPRNDPPRDCRSPRAV